MSQWFILSTSHWYLGPNLDWISIMWLNTCI